MGIYDNFSEITWEKKVFQAINTKYSKDLGFYRGKIGEYLGEGADGVVYEYGKNKVIKFIKPRLEIACPFSPKIFDFLQNNKNPFIIKIYKYGYFYSGKYKVNYYIAEKLKSPIFKGDKIWPLLKEKLYSFCVKNGLHYLDLHDENAMYDKKRKPKVIDLNSFVIKDRIKFNKISKRKS